MPAAETYFGGAFLWVPNLAKPDPYYIWPVLSGIFQFISQRMSMAYGASKNADSQTAMMNRIMQFTPIYLTVIYLNFAAGPVIYWTFSGIFTAVQTYIVNGFGSLPEFPGLHWLPKRIAPVTPEIALAIAEIDAEADAAQGRGRRRPAGATANGTNARPPAKGLMGRMMAQAVAAQEAQQQVRDTNGKAAPPATTNKKSATTPTTTTVVPTSTSNGGRKGYLAKMMEQATAMQEAQQAARAAPADGADEDEPEAETADGWSASNGHAPADTVSSDPTTAPRSPVNAAANTKE